jgi:transcriptional regulator with XRE-family HTH domain
MKVEELLRRIRAVGKLTQKDVAAATGLHQGAISKMERGVNRDVRSSTYLTLLAFWDHVQAQQQQKERAALREAKKAAKRLPVCPHCGKPVMSTPTVSPI